MQIKAKAYVGKLEFEWLMDTDAEKLSTECDEVIDALRYIVHRFEAAADLGNILEITNPLSPSFRPPETPKPVPPAVPAPKAPNPKAPRQPERPPQSENDVYNNWVQIEGIAVTKVNGVKKYRVRFKPYLVYGVPVYLDSCNMDDATKSWLTSLPEGVWNIPEGYTLHGFMTGRAKGKVDRCTELVFHQA
jgi:hypothetical protein